MIGIIGIIGTMGTIGIIGTIGTIGIIGMIGIFGNIGILGNIRCRDIFLGCRLELFVFSSSFIQCEVCFVGLVWGFGQRIWWKDDSLEAAKLGSKAPVPLATGVCPSP